MNRLIIVIVLLLLVAPLQSVAAQTNDAATDSGQPESNQEQLEELKDLYAQQIESYRQAEREYTIAKEQYQRLETLRLLEEAVQATRDAMIERNQVLLTYLDLLYFTLDQTPGINLEYKQQALDQLENQITQLRQYGEQLEATNNRDQLAQRVEEFNQLQPQIESVTYRSLSLISIGRLQAVHDKGRLILEDLQATEASRSALEQAQFDRAVRETERNLTNINDQLRSANDSYASQDNLVRKPFYDSILDRLEPVYVQLSQMISFLQELLTI